MRHSLNLRESCVIIILNVLNVMEVFTLNEEDLRNRILSDFTALGLPIHEVTLVFRPYSKTYYGRYYPTEDESRQKAKVAIYPYELNGDFMDYGLIMSTGIHELCHHIQYTCGYYVRRKGVMHNTNFWKLYNHYMLKAYQLGIIQKGGERVG